VKLTLGARGNRSSRLVATAMATGLLVAACGGKSAPNSSGGSKSGPITIGATYEKTGPAPTLGAEGPGIEAAANYLNAHGGVDGRKIKIVLEDDAGDPSQTIAQLRQFAAQGINIVLGAADGLCNPEAPIAAQLHQVVICGSTTDLPAGDSNMFGIGPGYTPTTKATVALVRRFATKEAALFADLSLQGQQSATLGPKDMRAVGLTPIVERYPPTTSTLRPEIQKAIAAGAQAIWDADCGPSAITAVGEAQSLGFKGKFVLQNCLASFQVAQALKGVAGTNRQVLTLSPYSLLTEPAPDPAERAAIAVYKSQVPGPVDTVESAGWDMMMVIARAIEAARSTSTSALLSTMENNFSYTGVWHAGTFTAQDHRGARLSGYAEPTYFTSQGTIQLLR
jgi:branched-chain amino acid transport system substrate-binding protein